MDIFCPVSRFSFLLCDMKNTALAVPRCELVTFELLEWVAKSYTDHPPPKSWKLCGARRTVEPGSNLPHTKAKAVPTILCKAVVHLFTLVSHPESSRHMRPSMRSGSWTYIARAPARPMETPPPSASFCPSPPCTSRAAVQ